MKINYKQLVDGIKSRPSINELSKILFQLGHEHEIQNNIFDFEFTPNKGDCLSIRGLLRELNSFYDVEIEKEIYIGDIIINLNKIKNKKIKKHFRLEFDRLWIHGLVHLFGHDHKKLKDFKKMNYIEKKYLNLVND